MQTRRRIGPVARDYELVVGPEFGGALQMLDVGDQSLEVREAVVEEVNQRAFRADIQLRDAGLAAIELHFDDLEQILGLGRQLAEAIDELRGKGLDLLRAIQLVEAPVETHAQIEVRHVCVRDQDGRIDTDLRRKVARLNAAEAAALGVEDRLLEHRLVEFEADFPDVPRLLVA